MGGGHYLKETTMDKDVLFDLVLVLVRVLLETMR
jgi:hypothetical protein